MSLFSKQQAFCRTCGKEMFVDLAGPGLKEWCSMECLKEFEWRRALSIRGREYYPKPEKRQ